MESSALLHETPNVPAAKKPYSIIASIACFLIASFLFVSFTKENAGEHAGGNAGEIATVRAQTYDFEFPGQADYIDSLPNLSPEVNERMYSGYLPVSNGVHIHYWLVESQTDPVNDPLVLWMNGGPGASSMEGLFNENGPFVFSADGKTLVRSEHSWNKRANLIFIESPAGVGFSYNTSGVYTVDDYSQASDNYEAIQSFYKKFPQYDGRQFHITGESYGGIYVPTLAKDIVDGNKAGRHHINLQSYAVGNGANEFLSNSIFYYAYYHGLMSMSEWKELKKTCPDLQEFQAGTLSMFDVITGKADSECGKARASAWMKFMKLGLNVFDIFRDKDGANPMLGVQGVLEKYKNNLRSATGDDISRKHPAEYGILSNTDVSDYLGRKEVKQALHVDVDIEWGMISIRSLDIPQQLLDQLGVSTLPRLNYITTRDMKSTDLWKYLAENNVRGVIYHGDTDLMCDFIGGQWAVHSLELPTITPYQPWYLTESSGEQQVAGFYEEFEKGLTFVVIKGSGHMVPQWKPKSALYMLHNWILKLDDVEKTN